MIKIKYIEGDVLAAPVDQLTLIMHVCNNQRAMGAGIALQIANKWPRVKEMYLLDKGMKLGTSHWVTVEKNLIVVNMIAQTLGWTDGKPPLDYEALEACLTEVANIASYDDILVRAPKIGNALGGGDWSIIEKMIEKTFVTPVEVYIFNP